MCGSSTRPTCPQHPFSETCASMRYALHARGVHKCEVLHWRADAILLKQHDIFLDYVQASGTCTSPLNKSQNVAAIIISTTSVALSVSIFSATIPSSAQALCFFRGGYALRVAAAADLPGGRSTGCVRARSG